MVTQDEDFPRGTKQPGPREVKDRRLKVLIADAGHSYRKFLKHVLESTGDLKVVGEAADREEVVRLAHQLKPDVVLMDINLQGTDAFDVTWRIKARLPETKVIMLSVLDGETYRKAAAKCGADAFLFKSAEISELLSVIRWGRSAPRHRV